MTILGKTVRGGLVLAALATGCGDDDRAGRTDTGGRDAGRSDAGTSDGGGMDARAMLDAGAFDSGSMLDAGRDSATSDATTEADAGVAESLRAALRAVCTKLNECDAASYPDVDACTEEYAATYAELPAECGGAYAAYLECVYTVDCSVLNDDTMLQAHIATECGDEVTAVETFCAEF